MELRPAGLEMRPPPGLKRQLVVEPADEPRELFTTGLPVGDEIPRRRSFPRSAVAGISLLALVGGLGSLAVPPSLWASPEPTPAAATVAPVEKSAPSMISAEGWNVAEGSLPAGGSSPTRAVPEKADQPVRPLPRGESVQQASTREVVPETGAPAVQDVPDAPTEQELLTPPRAAPLPPAQKGDYVKHRVNFSNLVSDRQFTDSEAANASDLQFFFESQGSFLADYVENGQSAAQIISAAAAKHEINPWVVLATLEKENSLVTRESQPGKATLRASMGYAYNDGGSSAGRHSTFGYQVEKGTALLRKLFDEGQQHRFPTRMRVDYGKRHITVRNAATYALMRYTPHTTDTRLRRIGGGNFLFERHLVRFQSDYAHFYQEAD